MDTLGQIAQRVVNGTVTVEARFVLKDGGADADEEMALSPFAKPGVSPVLLAVVTDHKLTRRKGPAKPAVQFFGY